MNKTFILKLKNLPDVYDFSTQKIYWYSRSRYFIKSGARAGAETNTVVAALQHY
jgi:hypothetical protein